MPAESLFFYIFSAAAVVSAIAVVLLQNTAFSAIALVATIISSAVLFGILDAHFLAAVQVLVYAGAIVVLFLFTIVFLNARKSGEEFGSSGAAKKLTFLIPAAGAAAYFGKQIAPFAAEGGGGQFDGGAAGVARLLLTEYLLAFEVTSLLIVAAIIGTVAVSRGLR
ncbi:MAG: NADH-quinone oxidoreductase subunit J [Thermodesulfobacteriota bacterium]